MNFKIGDRVEIIGDVGGIKTTGLTGQIVAIQERSLGIHFYVYNHEFHNLNGIVEEGYGLWVFNYLVKPLNNKPKTQAKELKISNKHFAREAKGFLYGIELETIVPYEYEDSVHDEVASIGFDYAGDGSIEYSDNEVDMEIKNSGPVPYDKLIFQADQIQSMAQNNDIRVNSSCGFHVHVSHPKFFNKKYLSRVISTWVAIEDFMYSTQPDSRQSNSYCNNQLNAYMQGYFDNIPNSKKKLVEKFGRYERYRSLNLASLQVHGTLECRLHAGTLSANKIKTWVYLLTAFYEYCLNDFNKAKVEELYLMEFTQEKVNKIYELLGIPKRIQSYFDRRINKMAVKNLQLQRHKAIKAYPLMDKLKKAKTKLKKAQQEEEKISSEFYQATEGSTINREFEQLQLQF